jgi:hypothetical protein
MRRMTRLTNGFSRKWENLKTAYALYFAYYNFCRIPLSRSNAESCLESQGLIGERSDETPWTSALSFDK